MTRLKVWFTTTEETVVFENVAGYRVMWDEPKKEPEAARGAAVTAGKCPDCDPRHCPVCTYQPDN